MPWRSMNGQMSNTYHEFGLDFHRICPDTTMEKLTFCTSPSFHKDFFYPTGKTLANWACCVNKTQGLEEKEQK